MIKRIARPLIVAVAALALTACESAEKSADRTGTQLEDRADQERENAIDQTLDRAFEGR